MLSDLKTESKKIGLQINYGKTKVMFNAEVIPQPLMIEGQTIERVEEYEFFGQVINTRRPNERNST